MSDTASEQQTTPSRARTPAGGAPAAPVGIVLALLVIVIGGVLIQDMLSHTGAVHRSWLASGVASVKGSGPQFWMVPLGVVLALLGLWLLLLGLKPRRRTGVQVDSNASIWLRPTDLARLAADTARHTPGVTDASATASSRAVRVRVTSTGTEAESLRDQVAAAVTDRFAILPSRPRVSVQAHTEGERS